jgi:hypothetical protein
MRDAEAPRRRGELARIEPVQIGRQPGDVDDEEREKDDERGRASKVIRSR